MLERFSFSLTGIIFGTIGIVVSLWGVVVLMNARVSASWPSVQGVVTESRVLSDYSHSSKKTTYQALVRYRYEVENTEYTCDTVSFGQFGSDRSSPAIETVKRYPVDAEVNVHYDPKKPKKAVLEPGVSWSSYGILGFGLIALVVGVGSCYSRDAL